MQNLLDRNRFLKTLDEGHQWDVIIIGGGATGLGTAVDAASRGLKTLLLEQSDFSQGTSSRSTKLIHGGVRYLAQGNIKLVYEGLRERWRLMQNAPHLVKPLSFVIPCYTWFSLVVYLIGLKLYDWLSGKYSIGPSERLTRKEVIEAMNGIRSRGLVGGVRYYDGQFDDSRLAISLAQTCASNRGVLLNYMKVTGLVKTDGTITGVVTHDLENGKAYTVYGSAVVNATGVFVDDVIHMDTSHASPMVRPSQGIHVVLDRSFMESDYALMIPRTRDGRVLFALPWQEHLLIGTTDTPLEKTEHEPIARQEEIDFVLETAGNYLSRQPRREDVLTVFAGLRPLVLPDKQMRETKEISRDHKLFVSASGLITITGGKWTTYRKMAQDTVDKIVKAIRKDALPCVTVGLRLHGYREPSVHNQVTVYGSDEIYIRELKQHNPEHSEPLLDGLYPSRAEVLWAVRNEMARTVEDVLGRRLRVLFTDASAAIKMAPVVAAIIAKELSYEPEWIDEQVRKFTSLAMRYLPPNSA